MPTLETKQPNSELDPTAGLGLLTRLRLNSAFGVLHGVETMSSLLSSKLLRASLPGGFGLRSGEKIIDSKLLGPHGEVLLVDLGSADSKHLDDVAPLLDETSPPSRYQSSLRRTVSSGALMNRSSPLARTLTFRRRLNSTSSYRLGPR